MVQVGIVDGSVPNPPNGSNSGWTLNNATGQPRSFVGHVNFRNEFKKVPEVIVSLCAFDFATAVSEKKVSVAAQNVTVSGFDYVISTWGPSVLYGASIAWTAATE